MTSDQGPGLIKGMWTAMGIAVVIVTLRMIAKIKIHHLGIDDAFMLFALSISLASTAFLTKSVQHGFGKDLETLPRHDLMMVLKYIAIQVPMITISTSAARVSFTLYLLNILGNNKRYQIALWGTMILQVAANIVSAVLPLSICRNVNILWDATVKTTCGNVVAVVKFSYFSSSVNTATDFFLAVFPTVVFWNLNLKTPVKVSLGVLLSLGLLAMVASIIKTTTLSKVPSVTNVGASGGVDLFRWGYAENAIIIITSSIPCIRPLVMSSVRKISSGKSRSYELTGPFSGPSGSNMKVRTTTGRSRNRDRYSSINDRQRRDQGQSEETDSIERILGSEDDRGIVKQVNITVVSNDGSHDGSSGRQGR